MPSTSRIRLMLGGAACVVSLGGCINMPSSPAQITGMSVSSLNYEMHDCNRLQAELDSLNRREAQLALAQEQRVRNSQMQAFWLGYGQGDGIEASELANVRGQAEAVRRASAINQCGAARVTRR